MVLNTIETATPPRDGQRFLVSVRADSGAPTIHVITNWQRAARGAVK